MFEFGAYKPSGITPPFLVRPPSSASMSSSKADETEDDRIAGSTVSYRIQRVCRCCHEPSTSMAYNLLDNYLFTVSLIYYLRTWKERFCPSGIPDASIRQQFLLVSNHPRSIEKICHHFFVTWFWWDSRILGLYHSMLCYDSGIYRTRSCARTHARARAPKQHLEHHWQHVCSVVHYIIYCY